MARKIPIDDLLYRACVYAESDREEFIAAHARMLDDPAAVEAIEFLKQLRAYRKKRWGKTNVESAIDAMTPVLVTDILRRNTPRGENMT